MTERLSVGAGPTLDLATLRFDPAVVAPPDDANGDGFASYASATHTRAVWGAGFQVGVHAIGRHLRHRSVLPEKPHNWHPTPFFAPEKGQPAPCTRRR